MPTWHAEVEFVGELADEQLEQVAGEATITGYNSETNVLRLHFRVQADDLDGAAAEALATVRRMTEVRHLVDAGVLAPRRVLVESEEAHAEKMPLIGSAAAAKILGVSQGRMRHVKKLPGFPEPALQLEGRDVYDRAAIEEFARRRNRKAGRPRQVGQTQ